MPRSTPRFRRRSDKNGLRNNTVVDLGVMASNKDKVETHCRMNQDVTLIEAAKNALSLPK